MRIVRRISDEQILGEIEAAGSRGLTARELSSRKGCDPITFAPAFRRLREAKKVRTEWTPVLPKNDAILQEARYWARASPTEKLETTSRIVLHNTCGTAKLSVPKIRLRSTT